MSLQFSDTTNKNGILQLIDANCGISSTNTLAYPIADKTRDINLALTKALEIALQASGTWKTDDFNHSDYPVVYTNLVSGQRDYSFSTDEDGNLILDIYKVFIKDEAGIYREIYPVDVEQAGVSNVDTTSFTDGQDIGGVPYRYDKMANGIFLDPIPNYNSTNGIKIYISREHTYFTSADTTKKAGIAGTLHEYLAVYPTYLYHLRNSSPNVDRWRLEVDRWEKKIQDNYSKKNKDTRNRFRPMYQNNK